MLKVALNTNKTNKQSLPALFFDVAENDMEHHSFSDESCKEDSESNNVKGQSSDSASSPGESAGATCSGNASSDDNDSFKIVFEDDGLSSGMLALSTGARSSENAMPASDNAGTPVDFTAGGFLRELNYCLDGYRHHNRGLQYAAENNFIAAFREWKLAYDFGYYPALYCLGNCYNLGKGVEQNIQKVFLLSYCMYSCIELYFRNGL